MKLYKVSVNKKSDNRKLRNKVKELEQIKEKQNQAIKRLSQKLKQQSKTTLNPNKKKLIHNSKLIDQYIRRHTHNTSQQLRLARILNTKYFMTKAPAYTFSRAEDGYENYVEETKYQYDVTYNEGIKIIKKAPIVWCFKIQHDSGKKITINNKNKLIPEDACFYKPAEHRDGESTIQEALTKL